MNTDGERLDWLESHDGFVDQWPEGDYGPRWAAHGANVIDGERTYFEAFGGTLREAIDAVMEQVVTATARRGVH